MSSKKFKDVTKIESIRAGKLLCFALRFVPAGYARRLEMKDETRKAKTSELPMF